MLRLPLREMHVNFNKYLFYKLIPGWHEMHVVVYIGAILYSIYKYFALLRTGKTPSVLNSNPI